MPQRVLQANPTPLPKGEGRICFSRSNCCRVCSWVVLPGDAAVYGKPDSYEAAYFSGHLLNLYRCIVLDSRPAAVLYSGHLSNHPNGFPMSVSALPESLPDSAREAFLAAGMRLYPELGYQRLSVRLLAAEAGLSPGMFHHLFASKEAFVAEVLQRKYDAAFAALQLQVRPGRGGRENLRDALRFLAFFARAHQDWVVRVFADAPTVASIREFVSQYAGMRHVSLIIDLLARAERQGLLVPAAPVQRSAFLMGAILAPMLIGSRLQASGLLPEFLAAAFAPQVMEDAAIVQRIDWALDVLFLRG